MINIVDFKIKYFFWRNNKMYFIY